ncbi:hypothetical protein EYF80_008354 [Liparis tanakae]|uniref:Uncharacterized protein n=1 Tax=Liparis tanakae TaxID=230148 RepID=A0A4Z2IUU3_9TELE|nr:hypothetical protein EYF80_008354 [Liparis tanakae]
MKHISDQQQDSLYEQSILFLSLLPVLNEKKCINFTVEGLNLPPGLIGLLLGLPQSRSSAGPTLSLTQVLSQVLPLQLVLVPLLFGGVQLAAQVPHLFLEELGGAVGLAVLLLAFELVELLLQCTILRLQELLVDGFRQGEVHLVVGEALGLGGRARALLVVGGGAGCSHRNSKWSGVRSRNVQSNYISSFGRCCRDSGKAVGDAGHQNHLRFEGPDCEVRVCDAELSGDQSASAVTEVPAEADVGTGEILAGIVELDIESNGSVLDEVLVVLVYIIDLGKGYGEGNLV